jgi:DNA repair/transcription protein MET18/MMS19
MTDPWNRNPVLKYTLSQVVPHFIKLFLSPDEVLNRAPVLAFLSEVIDVANRSSTNASDDLVPPLMQFKDEVIGVVTAGLKHPATIQPALGCIKSLLKAEDLLTDEELSFVVLNVRDVLLGDPEELGDVRYYINLHTTSDFH